MAKILYIGNDNPASTSAHRAHALQRLGHSLTIRNPYDVLAPSKLGKVHFRTGYRFIQFSMFRWIKKVIKTAPNPDLIWVDCGEVLGPICIKALKKLQRPLLLFNVDDPTGTRDGHRFDLLKKSLTLYDHMVVVRKESEVECREFGVKDVIKVWRSYDEVAHQPFNSKDDIDPAFKSEVAFIGTWMRHENRDEIFLQFIKNGIPFHIWGDRWQKSPHWNTIKPYYKGLGLGGRDYVAAIQGAKICLGLLSKGNRDLHTQRSLEIPFAAGLFCAERTTEHMELYKDGEEAVFWSDPKECVEVCKRLLQDDTLRENIRLAGMKRVRNNSVGNEDICRDILNKVLK